LSRRKACASPASHHLPLVTSLLASIRQASWHRHGHRLPPLQPEKCQLTILILFPPPLPRKLHVYARPLRQGWLKRLPMVTPLSPRPGPPRSTPPVASPSRNAHVSQRTRTTPCLRPFFVYLSCAAKVGHDLLLYVGAQPLLVCGSSSSWRTSCMTPFSLPWE